MSTTQSTQPETIVQMEPVAFGRRSQIDYATWHARLAGFNAPTTPMPGQGAAGDRPPVSAERVPKQVALAAD